MNRSKKGFLNTFSHLLDQLVTAICGFIVPKLVLESFGSEANGLVSSISHFLGVIALMESGFGSVAKTAFYKPLANRDLKEISGVYNATESFFRRIALIFAGYCIALSFVFPIMKDSSFSYWFVMSLVLILGIKSFMQYYFGISYTVLFNADQCGYFSGFLQIFAIILNAFLTVILVNCGAGIHVVKLVSATVFIIKPIVMNLYGKRKYQIDRSVIKDKGSLSQKWDNFGQSIALYIHTKTDSVLITLFLGFSEVSVYSVYSLVTTSLSSVINGISAGFVPGLGNMYAKGETENFNKVFSLYEFLMTFVSFLFYTIAYVMIIPFVNVYTANVDDVNYVRPLFSAVIIIGELIYCLRIPYYQMIVNARHFKQIKNGGYIEAIINIVLSLVFINYYGILGLAIGTAVAMMFRTAHLSIYCSKNIINRSIFYVFKRFAINLLCSIVSIIISNFIAFSADDFFSLLIQAVFVGIVTLFIFSLINSFFYKDDFKLLFLKYKSIFKR